MRTILILAMFLASLADAAWNGYEEVRKLRLDAGQGIDTLSIDAGAGSLEVTGVDGSSEILVTATIQVSEADEEKARRGVESDLVLVLEQSGNTATLEGHFEEGLWGWSESRLVNLAVSVPAGMHLDVNDGSGEMSIRNVRGDIEIDDGSGPMALTDVGGSVTIDDGSGSVTITGAGGDVRIDDGSGGIEVNGVDGSVVVDDGSGSIDVSDIDADLVIVNDGSGSLSYANIGGSVQKE